MTMAISSSCSSASAATPLAMRRPYRRPETLFAATCAVMLAAFPVSEATRVSREQAKMAAAAASAAARMMWSGNMIEGVAPQPQAARVEVPEIPAGFSKYADEGLAVAMAAAAPPVPTKRSSDDGKFKQNNFDPFSEAHDDDEFFMKGAEPSKPWSDTKFPYPALEKEPEEHLYRALASDVDHLSFDDITIPRDWAHKLFLYTSNKEGIIQLVSAGMTMESSDVYIASIEHEVGVGESVAFKVTDTEDERWQQELAMRSLLNGEGPIVPISEVRIFEESVFLLMPACDSTILEYLEKQTVMGFDQKVRIIADVLRAYAALESHDIVHDMTPEHVLVKDGRAYVTNFGDAYISSNEWNHKADVVAVAEMFARVWGGKWYREDHQVEDFIESLRDGEQTASEALQWLLDMTQSEGKAHEVAQKPLTLPAEWYDKKDSDNVVDAFRRA